AKGVTQGANPACIQTTFEVRKRPLQDPGIEPLQLVENEAIVQSPGAMTLGVKPRLFFLRAFRVLVPATLGDDAPVGKDDGSTVITVFNRCDRITVADQVFDDGGVEKYGNSAAVREDQNGKPLFPYQGTSILDSVGFDAGDGLVGTAVGLPKEV